MNEIEISELQKLNENPNLMNAIKKVLLYSLTEEIRAPKDYLIQPDEILGQIMKASAIAKELIERGFKELEKFKKVEAHKPPNVNIAR